MKRWFGIVLLLGLGVRWLLAWLPIETLIARTLPDDAFIYFVIARNIAAGLGATFDGLHATNGFHPLWAMLISPIFWLIPKGDGPIHWVLTLGAVCDVLAGVVSAWVVERLTRNRLAAGLTLGLYLFNPRLIQESVNGLETGLALLCVAVCLAAWVWLTEAPQKKGRAMLFGGAAGLVVLARSDLAIIPLLFFFVGAIRYRAQILNLILGGAVAGLTVSPWWVWSQVRVGTVVQSSGVAIPSLVAAHLQAAPDFATAWDQLLLPVINFSVRNGVTYYSGIALLAIILGVILVRWPRRSDDLPRPATGLTLDLWLPLLGALVIVAIHTFVRWYPRGWYFAPVAWGGALVGGPVLAAGLTSPAGRRFGWLIVGLLGCVVIGQAFKMMSEPDYFNQSDMRAGADWLKTNTPATATVGAFNAGIYAYYSERRVLSLDGLVDWGAIEARQHSRLLDYFVEQGGTLVIDQQAYVESFSAFFGARRLEMLQTLPMTNTVYGPITVYTVR